MLETIKEFDEWIVARREESDATSVVIESVG
jgi:hypothetical protein